MDNILFLLQTYLLFHIHTYTHAYTHTHNILKVIINLNLRSHYNAGIMEYRLIATAISPLSAIQF